jgi:photosystem II stability/assembly factor-like uncharacterized protein
MKAVKILTIVVATLIAADFAFAQTWMPTTAPMTNWNSIVCSADGTKLAATFSPGFIYLSTNSGTSWTTSNIVRGSWSSLNTSADGNKLVVLSNNTAIYISTDSGASWIQSFQKSDETFYQIVSSTDGNKLVAMGSPYVCASTNSGTTWATNISPSSAWTSVACSANGQMLIANYQFGFYLSTDSGTTWTNISDRLPPTETRYVGCSSADGSKWTIIADAGIIISTNSGVTWTLNYNNNLTSGSKVACSADGSKLIASQRYVGGEIYMSTNSGSTWWLSSAPQSPAYSVASSADGCRFVAASTNGIYTFQSAPSPQLNLTFSNVNLALSWTIPSTNFVLQQSSDLTSWADVTNAPALNLTNLQNQVMLSPSNSIGFYRLKTP